MAALGPQWFTSNNCSVQSMKEPINSNFIFCPFEKLWLEVRSIEESYVILLRVKILLRAALRITVIVEACSRLIILIAVDH